MHTAASHVFAGIDAGAVAIHRFLVFVVRLGFPQGHAADYFQADAEFVGGEEARS